jgi:hypothetical protein
VVWQLARNSGCNSGVLQLIMMPQGSIAVASGTVASDITHDIWLTEKCRCFLTHAAAVLDSLLHPDVRACPCHMLLHDAGRLCKCTLMEVWVLPCALELEARLQPALCKLHSLGTILGSLTY